MEPTHKNRTPQFLPEDASLHSKDFVAVGVTCRSLVVLLPSTALYFSLAL